MSFYELMQQIGEAFTHDDQLKKSVVDVDPFTIVNRLRKDRDKMVEDYATYKLLFQCLGYYGSNRRLLNQFVSKTQIEKSKETRTNHEEGRNELEEEIEYILHEPENGDDNIFDDYYDNGTSDHHRYQNIEEMSEYI